MENMLRNVKGTKDYMPQEQGLRNRIRQTFEEVFAAYGCKPLETPTLQYFELLGSKYGGGAEILKEVYRINDQGGRDLALRYDLTVPLAKVIGMNPDMRMPFKRYEIGKVFRDGPVKTGRFREFIQCDVDIVGASSMLAEAELISMASEAFDRLGLAVAIHLNNRKLLTGLLKVMGIGEEQAEDVMLSLDKLEKIGLEGVCADLRERQVEEAVIERIAAFLQDGERSLASLAQRYEEPLVQEGARELSELFALVEGAGISAEVRFAPFLARGLSIYTGTVYEIFLQDGRITSSIGSGGRYDRIIGQLLGDGRSYPAVGISFGLDVILTALTMGAGQTTAPSSDVLVIPLGTEAEGLRLAQRIRKCGLRVEVELMGRRLKRALDYANKERIPLVVLFGEQERARGQMVVKDMYRGEEELVQLDDEQAWMRIFSRYQQ